MVRFHILCLTLFAVAPAALAQRPSPGSGSVKSYEPEDPHQEMQYSVFTPSSMDRGRLYALLLAAHGTGAQASRYCRKVSGISSRDLPVIVLAVQHQRPGGNSAPNHTNRFEKCRDILDKVCREYPVDVGRMFVQGFSRGGLVISDFVQAKWDEQNPFPFRAAFVTGNRINLRGRVPEISYVSLIGALDRYGGTNVPQNNRRHYREHFPRGVDFDYYQLAKTKHQMTEQIMELMRQAVARVPDYSDASLFRKPLPDAIDAIRSHGLSGRFAEAYAVLESAAAEAVDDAKLGRAIASAAKKLDSYLKKKATAAAKTTRKSPATIHRYRELRRVATTLEAFRPELAERFGAAADKLAKKKGMADQIAAERDFHAAWQSLRDNVDEGNGLMEKLATGALARTFYGHRARRHMVGWRP